MPNIKLSIFPKSIYIIIFTFILYYWNIIFYGEDKERIMVFFSIILLIIGRLFQKVVSNNVKVNKKKLTINYSKLNILGLILMVIGIFAHVFFYSSVEVSNYVDNYNATRGKGYITVFFDFLPIGALIMIQSSLKQKNKLLVFIIFIILSAYCGFYFLELMKRKQILLVLLGLAVLFFNKVKISKLVTFYVLGILLYVVFTVFAMTRKLLQHSTISETWSFIKTNFSFEWISPSNFEGKYASIILEDIVLYVNTYGIEPKIILGVVSSVIPRNLFGSKFIAFPEWYSSTFHPYEYQQGAGFAGSLIAESFLLFSWAGVILICFFIGFTTKKIDYLYTTEMKLLYVVIVYVMLFLPRYDLASIFISFTFMFLPVYLVYILSMKKVGEKR